MFHPFLNHRLPRLNHVLHVRLPPLVVLSRAMFVEGSPKSLIQSVTNVVNLLLIIITAAVVVIPNFHLGLRADPVIVSLKCVRFAANMPMFHTRGVGNAE